MYERIPQSVAKRIVFKAFLASDHVTAATGKTIPVQVSKNGGAFADLDTPSNATEIANGWYYIDLAAADTGTLGPLITRGTEATIDPAEIVCEVVAATNAGFSSLPDAAADAAGGLPISDAGGLDMDGLSTYDPASDEVDIGKVKGVAVAGVADFRATGFSTHSAGDVYTAFGTGANLTALTTATGFSTHSAADVYTAFGTGAQLTALTTATGFSTHSAADVYTAFGTGAQLTALTTATGFSTHSAADVWTQTTRTLSAFGFSVTVGTNNDKTGYALTAAYDAAKTAADATDLAAVKAVTDKVDDTLELDSGTYRFTAAALAEAPSGTGATPTEIWDHATRTLTAFAHPVQLGDVSHGGTAATLQLSDYTNFQGPGAGAGAKAYTVTVDDGTNPLDGVDVWVTSDVAGTSVVASGYTDGLGQIIFQLDPGTYYLWKQLAGYNFTNPETITVT